MSLTMNLGPLARKYRSAIIQTRVSPVSRAAALVTLALATLGLTTAIVTKFSLLSLTNIVPLILGIAVIDIVSRFAPQTRIVEAVQTALYGILYLVITCACGVFAAYALQRLALPLQDQFLADADHALGLDWLGYARWVDRHVAVQTIFYLAYRSFSGQIALPLMILAFANRPSETRTYLLAFAIALAVTVVVSALMPAAGPIISVDRDSFAVLRFTGATPLEHLLRLREAGPLIMSDAPGGIATFPSFHATVAILTPLTLRGYPRLFAALFILDAAMLGGAVTEGAHYFSDILAGASLAFLAHAVASRLIRAESNRIACDRSLAAAHTKST